MMEIALNVLRAFVLGLISGLVYDIFRIVKIAVGVCNFGRRGTFAKVYARGLKNVFPDSRGRVFSLIVTFFCDVLFFIIASVMFVLFLYVFNYGTFRALFLIAAVAGFISYRSSVGRIVLGSAGMISDLIRLIFNLITAAVRAPLVFLLRIIKKALRATVWRAMKKIKGNIDKRRMRRYTLLCTKRLSDFISVVGSK